MVNINKSTDINSALDKFIDDESIDCTGDRCIIKNDKSIVEVVKKKIITDDGRLLLI